MTGRHLPGDPSAREAVRRMVRVDHAGEYGAKRIYAGQIAVLKRHESAPLIRHMAAQEEAHLVYFEREIARRGVRPTLLHPLWHIAGYALGAATALLGEKAAMACTAAVEAEIDRHYAHQIGQLGDSDPALSEAIERFRGEEDEHRTAALEAGAEQAPAYRLLEAAIRLGCRLAIRTAERV